MKLSDQKFYMLFSNAMEAPSRDVFVSDWSLSSLVTDTKLEPVSLGIAETLGNIWDVAHLTVRDIRKSTGLSQAAFAKRFCIPRRTVENWETTGNNHNECPIYTRLLLADACGLLCDCREH